MFFQEKTFLKAFFITGKSFFQKTKGCKSVLCEVYYMQIARLLQFQVFRSITQKKTIKLPDSKPLHCREAGLLQKTRKRLC